MLTFLTANDLFTVGRVAYDNRDYYHALIWLDAALQLAGVESALAFELCFHSNVRVFRKKSLE